MNSRGTSGDGALSAVDGPADIRLSNTLHLHYIADPGPCRKADSRSRIAGHSHNRSPAGAARVQIRPVQNTSAFELPEHAAKAAPALIADDERHFAAIAESLERSTAELTARLAAARLAPAGLGQAVLERDAEIARLSSSLRALRRFGLDLCLGHVVGAGHAAPVYIGRLGLLDGAGDQLLLDWRSPAAEPFFGATRAHPMGIERRRRYRWRGGKIFDYWDEVFTAGGFDESAALDDESAFIASLGANRSPQMRDVLGTIAADQDAIIRGSSRGALVVEGGPGTGKTVVALHRAAYLLYGDSRLGNGRGDVLFIGPHQPYLSYVANVLPSLGEDGVALATLRDLQPEGAAAADEPDAEVARLKSSADLVRAIEAAVRFYEEPPTATMTVETDWADIALRPADWREAFAAVEAGTPHNEAREQIWASLLDILQDNADGAAPPAELRRALQRNAELRAALENTWTLIEAADLVGDLFSVPAYLRACAPWLSAEEVRTLQRADPQAWTVPDLPLLDAARQRLGDPETARRARRHTAALAAERARMADVVEDLIAADDSELLVMSMLRGADLRNALEDESALPAVDPDALAGPFAHIVVDEAQELTDAQWQMLLRRCPSRSFTIVGDRAQARHGFAESWRERLERAGFGRITMSALSVNYRTPEEVMAEAEPVIRAALPDANVPTSIRRSGIPVAHGLVSELAEILDGWLAANEDGTACVISAVAPELGRPRVRRLTPTLAKGLEFDLVVLLDPASFGDGIEGAVDRYVAMTRATRRLVILE